MVYRRYKAKHGIDFVEAQTLWSDLDRIELPARPTNEPRFLIVGQIMQAVWTATVTYRHADATTEAHTITHATTSFIRSV